MQAVIQSQPPALFAAAPNGQAAPAAFDLTGVGIEEASSRAAFFVTGTSNNEPLKEALKKLGGAWNSRMKGYKHCDEDHWSVQQHQPTGPQSLGDCPLHPDFSGQRGSDAQHRGGLEEARSQEEAGWWQRVDW
jgi:hypothetical protein